MTMSNIKGLPEGRYFTEIGYSQSYAWKVIKETAKTVTLALVEVNPDPDFEPEFEPGGFCAHCTNQSAQTWLFYRVDMEHQKTIRKTKKGWSYMGTRFAEHRARHFYDWNF